MTSSTSSTSRCGRRGFTVHPYARRIFQLRSIVQLLACRSNGILCQAEIGSLLAGLLSNKLVVSVNRRRRDVNLSAAVRRAEAA
jgi:hypothetical protein